MSLREIWGTSIPLATRLEKGLEPARPAPPTRVTPSSTQGAAGGSPGLCSAQCQHSQRKQVSPASAPGEESQEEEEAWLAARAAAHLPGR